MVSVDRKSLVSFRGEKMTPRARGVANCQLPRACMTAILPATPAEPVLTIIAQAL